MAERVYQVTISCLCAKHRHTYAFPDSVKTIDYVNCHCNSCRKASGSGLYHGALLWKYPLVAISDSDDTPQDPKQLVRKYDFGPSLDYWFCDICSTKMYWQYKKPDADLEIFPGLVPDSFLKKANVKMNCSGQYHVQDTLDEGLSRCFKNSHGAIVDRYQDGDGSDAYRVQPRRIEKLAIQEIVEGQCHCQQTTFQLRRRKYPVELDVSKEARLLSSVDLSSWALVPREDVISVNNMPLHILQKLTTSASTVRAGSISTYEISSIATVVFFCNNCSATVLLQPKELRDEALLRFGCGLFKSKAGARAEDVLDWSSVRLLEIVERDILVDPETIPASL